MIMGPTTICFIMCSKANMNDKGLYLVKALEVATSSPWLWSNGFKLIGGVSCKKLYAAGQIVPVMIHSEF